MSVLNGSGPITGADYTLAHDEVDGVTVLTLRRSSRPPTAAEMREVEVMSKKPISAVQTDLALAQQMVIWLFLRRRGVECSWADAADIVLETQEDTTLAVDPTDGALSLTSPPSATTGE
jgi:hypothetical protein